MSAHGTKRLAFVFFPLSLATMVMLGAPRSARAADDSADPFADTSPKGTPGTAAPPSSLPPQAPASAPQAPANAISPGIVEELPASAYPEPYTRGLYGGPLWLDMQGLQWPYTPRTGIGISGYGWLDNMYRLIRLGGNQSSDHNTKLFQQGRFLLRVTPTYTSGNWFVQAQAEIVASKDQYVVDATSNQLINADDVWVRVGAWDSWDVTVGRMQAFDVYPLGMGLDLNSDERLGAIDTANPTAPFYAADFLLYRPAGPGDVALHLYPFRFLRFEGLAQYGNGVRGNYVGGRPAAIFDVGWLKIRGALEYLYNFAQDPSPATKDTEKRRGGGGSAQIVLAPWVEFGVNAAYAIIDVANPIENLEQSGNEYSYGGFIDATPFPGLPNLMIGGGGNFTSFHDLNRNGTTGPYERSTNLQTFAAIQYLFFRELYVKLVGSYAKSHFDNENSLTPYDDDMLSVRLRVMYLY